MKFFEILNTEKAFKKYEEYYFLYLTFLIASFTWAAMCIGYSIVYTLQKGVNWTVVVLLLIAVFSPLLFYQLFKTAFRFKKYNFLHNVVALLNGSLIIFPIIYFKEIHDILGILLY